MKFKLFATAMSLTMLCSSVGYATEESNKNLDLGVGLAATKSIYYAKKKTDLTLFPLVSLNMGNFYIDGIGDIGYALPLTDSFSTMVFVQPFDGFEIEPNDLLPEYRSIKKRRSQVAVGGGFAYALDNWGVDNTLFSVIAKGGKRGVSSEMTLSKAFLVSDRFIIEPKIGMSYYSSKYTDYYFGIKNNELGGKIKEVYKPEAAYGTHIGISSSYALTEHLGMELTFGWDKFSKQIKKSPIVKYDSQFSSILSLYYSF